LELIRRYSPEVQRSAARLAGRELLPLFGVRDVSRYKGRHDVQLRADLIAQKIILDALQNAFPASGVLAEEDASTPGPERELLWVVDPLDGTNNFGYGIAHCAISITLFHENEVVLALVFDPIQGREFSAVRGITTSSPTRREDELTRATVSLVTPREPGGSGDSRRPRRWVPDASGYSASGPPRSLRRALELALQILDRLHG
jgi:myo-inositol-1(or 4)-monophosphatase